MSPKRPAKNSVWLPWLACPDIGSPCTSTASPAHPAHLPVSPRWPEIAKLSWKIVAVLTVTIFHGNRAAHIVPAVPGVYRRGPRALSAAGGDA